jgi:hypothetical protein
MWQHNWAEGIHILSMISLHRTCEKFLPVICNCDRTRTNKGQAYNGRFACTPFPNVARSRVLSVSTIAAIPARPSTCGTCNYNRHTFNMSPFVTSVSLVQVITNHLLTSQVQGIPTYSLLKLLPICMHTTVREMLNGPSWNVKVTTVKPFKYLFT